MNFFYLFCSFLGKIDHVYVFLSTERRCFSSQLFFWAIAGTAILLLSACFITRCVGEFWGSHSSCLVNIRSEFFLVDCGFSSPTKGISISLVTQMVKNPPMMQEMWVLSLRQEDPLERELATHSCILAWEIPWTEEPGTLQTMGLQRVRHNWVTDAFPHIYLQVTPQARNPNQHKTGTKFQRPVKHSSWYTLVISLVTLSPPSL